MRGMPSHLIQVDGAAVNEEAPCGAEGINGGTEEAQHRRCRDSVTAAHRLVEVVALGRPRASSSTEEFANRHVRVECAGRVCNGGALSRTARPWATNDPHELRPEVRDDICEDGVDRAISVNHAHGAELPVKVKDGLRLRAECREALLERLGVVVCAPRRAPTLEHARQERLI